MGTYNVEISQIRPRWKSDAPYEVKIFGPDGMSIEVDWTATIWGTKRIAKKMIKKIEGGEFKPKFITSYEVKT